MKRKLLIITFLILFPASLLFSEEEAKYSPDRLVESMKTNSANIKQMKGSLSQANLSVKKAIGDYFPKISYGVTAAYIGNPIKKITMSSEDAMTLFDWPEGVTPTSNGGYVTLYDGMEKSYYNFSLTAIQPIVTWGKLTSQLHLYQTLERIQSDNLSFTLLQNEAQIRARVEAVYYLQKISEVCRSSQGDADRLSELVAQIQASGMATSSTTYEALTAAYAMRYANASADAEIVNQEQSLRDLTGLYDLSLDQIEIGAMSKEEYEKLFDISEFEMVARAISDNKETVRMASSMVDIANIRKKVSDFSMLYTPDIVGIVSLSYGGSRFPLFENGWYSKDDWQAIVALKLSGNLFDGGKQFFNKQNDAIGVDNAKYQKESTINQLTESVKSTRGQLSTALIGIDYKGAVLREKEEKYRETKEAYEAGSKSEIEYLKSSLEKTQAEVDLYGEYVKASTAYWTLSVLI